MRRLSLWQKAGITGKAALDRRTPLSAKGLLLCGILYGILPVDFIPDLVPILGIADDAAIILGVLLIFLHWTKDIRKTLEERRA